MARYKNGINGSFKGKVGTVIGCKWKGIDYMRSLPKARESRPLSDAELATRKKFAAAHFWLKPIIPFVRVGFKNYTPTVQGFVAAKSYLLKNAITGIFPDYIIDPSLALVSYGDLPGAVDPQAVLADNVVTFNWEAGSNENGADSSDFAMLLAYDTLNDTSYHDIAAARRKKGVAVLELEDDGVSIRDIELYIAFISEDRERISNSQYLGNIKVGG